MNKLLSKNLKINPRGQRTAATSKPKHKAMASSLLIQDASRNKTRSYNNHLKLNQGRS